MTLRTTTTVPPSIKAKATASGNLPAHAAPKLVRTVTAPAKGATIMVHFPRAVAFALALIACTPSVPSEKMRNHTPAAVHAIDHATPLETSIGTAINDNVAITRTSAGRDFSRPLRNAGRRIAPNANGAKVASLVWLSATSIAAVPHAIPTLDNKIARLRAFAPQISLARPPREPVMTAIDSCTKKNATAAIARPIAAVLVDPTVSPVKTGKTTSAYAPCSRGSRSWYLANSRQIAPTSSDSDFRNRPSAIE